MSEVTLSSALLDVTENRQTVECGLLSGGESISEGSRDEEEELNLESVLTAVQDFQKELWEAQRDRVETKRKHVTIITYTS